jgi:hypothetical protein
LVYAGVVVPVLPEVPATPPVIFCTVPEESITRPPVAISNAYKMFVGIEVLEPAVEPPPVPPALYVIDVDVD